MCTLETSQSSYSGVDNGQSQTWKNSNLMNMKDKKKHNTKIKVFGNSKCDKKNILSLMAFGRLQSDLHFSHILYS